MIIARLFPGIAEELVSDGAIASDVPAESLRYQLGGYRVRFSIGRKSLLMSRPFLEEHIRRRVRALPGVTVLDGHAVTGLLSAGDEKRVGGVTVKRRAQGASERRLDADLVVDASGRGSRAPAVAGRDGLRASRGGADRDRGRLHHPHLPQPPRRPLRCASS